MTLYHGSNQSIDEINLQKSRPYKDFGRAFYLSDTLQQATEMALFKSELEGGEPAVSQFAFDENLMNSSALHILKFKEYSEEWARFVFANRDAANESPVHDYDIVYGPIANDRVGRQIANLKDGYIDFETFIKRLKFMKGITFQYAFCSEKAVALLAKI